MSLKLTCFIQSAQERHRIPSVYYHEELSLSIGRMLPDGPFCVGLKKYAYTSIHVRYSRAFEAASTSKVEVWESV
jgi:hypothetical protein